MDDAEAFAAFYAASHAPVHAAVRITLDDPHLAREATDEAFVRAAERWSDVAEATNRDGWVYRVAVNWATSWRRKLVRRPTRADHELDRAHTDVLPDVDLQRWLDGLPLDQRQLLVLRFVLGLSVRETAEALGVAEGTVKSGVHRARQRLLDDRAGDRDLAGRREDGDGRREDSEVLDGRA